MNLLINLIYTISGLIVGIWINIILYITKVQRSSQTYFYHENFEKCLEYLCVIPNTIIKYYFIFLSIRIPTHLFGVQVHYSLWKIEYLFETLSNSVLPKPEYYIGNTINSCVEYTYHDKINAYWLLFHQCFAPRHPVSVCLWAIYFVRRCHPVAPSVVTRTPRKIIHCSRNIYRTILFSFRRLPRYA